MTAGKQIIVELGKRGLRGYFFTYDQYQELKKLTDFNDLKKKIALFGYQSVVNANDAKEIVNILQKEQKLQGRNGCFTLGILEILFWTAISLATCS